MPLDVAVHWSQSRPISDGGRAIVRVHLAESGEMILDQWEEWSDGHNGTRQSRFRGDPASSGKILELMDRQTKCVIGEPNPHSIVDGSPSYMEIQVVKQRSPALNLKRDWPTCLQVEKLASLLNQLEKQALNCKEEKPPTRDCEHRWVSNSRFVRR